jgi:ADP-ribose pyrophosphatase YjhB (NUDIX family)
LQTYARLPRRVRLALLHTLAPRHTVGALCFLTHGDRVLLLRQHHRRGWTLPGGLLDRGEDARHAVMREVLEETGLIVEAGEPITTVVDPDSRRVDILFHVPVDRPLPVQASGEAIEAAWLTREEAGRFDTPTAQSFAAFARSRATGSHTGRLIVEPAG